MYSIIRNGRIWLLVVATAIGLIGSTSAQMINSTDVGLGGANSITGTVLTPSGTRLQGRVSVRLTTMTKGDRVAVTDDAGNFGFRGLTNGDYLVTIDKEKDFEPFSQNVNVFQMRGTPGQNYMLSVRLKSKAGTAPKPGVINAELAKIPKQALELYYKALELAKNGDRAGAILQLQSAIAEYPEFMLAYNEIGVQHMHLNEMEKADLSFVSALKIKPDAFEPLTNRAIVLFSLGRCAEAEPLLRNALKIKEQSAVAHYFLGQVLANLGRFDEAEPEYVSAVKLGGDEMKEAHRILAIIYRIRKDNARALVELETYLRLAPKAPDAEQLRQLVIQIKGASAPTAVPRPE